MRKLFLGMDFGNANKRVGCSFFNRDRLETKILDLDVSINGERIKSKTLPSQVEDEEIENSLIKMLRDMKTERVYSKDLNQSRAVIYDFLHMYKTGKIYSNIEFTQIKKLGIFNFGSQRLELTTYSLIEKNEKIEIKEESYSNIFELGADGIDLEIEYYLSKKYQRRIGKELSEKIKLSLNSKIESNLFLEKNMDDIKITIEEVEFSLKECEKLLNPYLEELLKKEELEYLDYYLLNGGTSKFCPIKNEIIKRLNSQFLNYTDPEFSVAKGMSIYASKIYAETINFVDDFTVEEEFKLDELFSLYENYEKAMLVGTKKILLEEIKGLEGKLIKLGDKYIDYLIETLPQENSFKLNRYVHLLGEIEKNKPKYKEKLGEIFLDMLSLNRLISLKTFVPEHINFAILGLGKINYTEAEEYLREILEYPNCKNLIDSLVESLGIMGVEEETVDYLLELLILNKNYRKEIFLAMGRIGTIQRGVERDIFNEYLSKVNRFIKKETSEEALEMVLYSVAEICYRKNRGLREDIIQSLRNNISDIVPYPKRIEIFRDIALKVLNFKILLPEQEEEILNIRLEL